MTQPITSRLVEANGLSFMVDECGEGPDVALCLHGFPESRHSWRYQLPVLAEQGWRAVAPDLRGYGQSSRPKNKSDYRIEHLMADAAALFDELGARRRLLIAHDWGAAIAWGFAIEKARPLDGLIIMNVPHPSVFLANMANNPAQWKKSWYIAFFQLPWLPELALTARNAEGVAQAFTGMAVDKSRFPPEVVNHYRANAQIPGAMTAMVNYYRANTDTMRRWAPGKAAVIEVPTLMLWGEADAALGIELTEGYEGLVRDFTLRRFPGVSHWVQQEAPEAVNAAMTAWMAEKGLGARG